MFISLMLYSILELALVRYNGACPKNAVKFKINSSQIIQKKTEDFYHSSPSVTTQEEYFLLCNKRISFEGQCVNEKALTFDLI